MKSELARHSKWLDEFKDKIFSEVIRLKKQNFQVKGLLVTSSIKQRLDEEHGYEITDLLGYTITIDNELYDSQNCPCEYGFFAEPLQ